MRYLVREKDQWGAVAYYVDDTRIWKGNRATGLPYYVVEGDPRNDSRSYIKRENTYGERLFCIEPNPHGEGLIVKKGDTWGERLYFVEESRYAPGDYLVREGDQHGSVVFYVAPYLIGGTGEAGGSGGQRPETAFDRFLSSAFDALYGALLAPKSRFGKNGALIAIFGWFLFLLLVGAALHVVGLSRWYGLPFGILVAWGIFQVVRLYT